MAEKIFDTESLCPECLKKIPAWYEKEEGKVYLHKTCPDHGQYKVLFWRDGEMYDAWRAQAVHAQKQEDKAAVKEGCPYDCGLCSEHEGGTCTAVMEITYRCNMECNICFADAMNEKFDPSMEEIRQMFDTAWRNGGECSVQLSGGEPTLRDDLPEIIRTGKKMGFPHLQVNTNGIRISGDLGYLESLKHAGADLIYLQFDGTNRDIYTKIRGRDVLDIKLRAIENCKKVGIGVLLVPTIIPKINMDNIGEMVRFAREHMPVVKGIHFQPVSYFGRFPADVPQDDDRCGLCDIIHELETQTKGEMKASDFVPRKRYDPHCAFSGLFFLPEKGGFQAITQKMQNELLSDKTDFAGKTNAFTRAHWRMSDSIMKDGQSEMERFRSRLRDYTLSVSGMGFQDVWNIDIGRLKGCCVHVVTRDGNAAPLCAFHLTSTSGERLYQNG